ncbi:hypothetical protein EAM_2869 [Erwinia amylovora ATCC 49946]|uniref:Uncharacterized protein n=1 Tax=Erwinia amylovora TaxID=552 RepID=Q58PV7_ERWAM|nr:hypothetical protein [Erwinia amylovora]CBJ47543.1 hypothetical protein EAM_2869 [Erwinia amylovora ATCC 49946]
MRITSAGANKGMMLSCNRHFHRQRILPGSKPKSPVTASVTLAAARAKHRYSSSVSLTKRVRYFLRQNPIL